MTVSFKVAKQPSELKVHTTGLRLCWFSGFFYLNCSDVPCIYHFESKVKKQTYMLYFNII